MDKLWALIILAIGCILKLLITGICLAIGFRVGNILCVEAEKRIAEVRKTNTPVTA